jgi:hypothetical protein
MISLGKEIGARQKEIPKPSSMPYSESKSESHSREIFELAVCTGLSDLVEDLIIQMN